MVIGHLFGSVLSGMVWSRTDNTTDTTYFNTRYLSWFEDTSGNLSGLVIFLVCSGPVWSGIGNVTDTTYFNTRYWS